MSRIQLHNLTFSFEGAVEPLFQDVNLNLDTEWKLALIGRNGKGKTTLLRLINREMAFRGEIKMDEPCKYYPYIIKKQDAEAKCYELIELLEPDAELWRVTLEAEKLYLAPDFLEKKYSEMSAGEQAKFLLAILFSIQNRFLLIDEPTNHLDHKTKEVIGTYLNSKNGFILVSHDRDVIDMCADHMLILNKTSIELQKGNYSSWWDNKVKLDSFKLLENEKHTKEINKLAENKKKVDAWAKANEATKIGFDPIEEPDRCKDTRGYIGAKTKKINKRMTALDARISKEIRGKSDLLNDIENIDEMKINYTKPKGNLVVKVENVSISYKNQPKSLLNSVNMSICEGDCVFLKGGNGSGKSTLIKHILDRYHKVESKEMDSSGYVKFCPELSLSYVSQVRTWKDISVIKYVNDNNIDAGLFFSIINRLGVNPKAIKDAPITELSDGEKKKIQLAESILTPANLYIWDEPFNYLDIYSRMQLEEMILKHTPTMIVVDHDKTFMEKCSTNIVDLAEFQ